MADDVGLDETSATAQGAVSDKVPNSADPSFEPSRYDPLSATLRRLGAKRHTMAHHSFEEQEELGHFELQQEEALKHMYSASRCKPLPNVSSRGLGIPCDPTGGTCAPAKPLLLRKAAKNAGYTRHDHSVGSADGWGGHIPRRSWFPTISLGPLRSPVGSHEIPLSPRKRSGNRMRALLHPLPGAASPKRDKGMRRVRFVSFLPSVRHCSDQPPDPVPSAVPDIRMGQLQHLDAADPEPRDSRGLSPYKGLSTRRTHLSYLERNPEINVGPNCSVGGKPKRNRVLWILTTLLVLSLIAVLVLTSRVVLLQRRLQGSSPRQATRNSPASRPVFTGDGRTKPKKTASEPMGISPNTSLVAHSNMTTAFSIPTPVSNNTPAPESTISNASTATNRTNLVSQALAQANS